MQEKSISYVKRKQICFRYYRNQICILKAIFHRYLHLFPLRSSIVNKTVYALELLSITSKLVLSNIFQHMQMVPPKVFVVKLLYIYVVCLLYFRFNTIKLVLFIDMTINNRSSELKCSIQPPAPIKGIQCVWA